MNIVFLGCPGSGKGVQARILSRKLGLKHLSPGDIFWNELDKKTTLGHEVEDYLVTGRLVPDWLVIGTLKERLKTEKGGLLFDGFPRTMEQAEGLSELLASRTAILDAVVYFNLTEAEAIKRLASRRVCPGCGMIYNLDTAKPFMETICDSCGGPLKVRNDDKAGIVKNRLMAYRDQTEPLISYYRGNAEFFEVKAAQPPAVLANHILSLLKKA